MVCRHEDCLVTRACIKLVWMAATDAVACPEYSQLLEESYKGLAGLALCPDNGCLIRRAIPDASSQPISRIFLQKILSNCQAPDQVIRRVLCLAAANSDDGAILDAVAELAASAHELRGLEAMDAALALE